MKAISSRVGIFSDIHIGLGQNSQVWHESVLEMACWIRDVYKTNNISDIFIPGDIFHNRNEISVNTLDIGRRFFEILKDFNIFNRGSFYVAVVVCIDLWAKDIKKY
jgi:DNA repair exonuclease SbcCD nuclease subunit